MKGRGGRAGRDTGYGLWGQTPGRKPQTKDPNTVEQGSSLQLIRITWEAYENSRFQVPAPGSPGSEVWPGIWILKRHYRSAFVSLTSYHHSTATLLQKDLWGDFKTCLGGKRLRRRQETNISWGTWSRVRDDPVGRRQQMSSRFLCISSLPVCLFCFSSLTISPGS